MWHYDHLSKNSNNLDNFEIIFIGALFGPGTAVSSIRYIDVHECCQLEFGATIYNFNSDQSYNFFVFFCFGFLKTYNLNLSLKKYKRAICF